MALPATNAAEGGTNGTLVTVANSGGASGTAFDSVQQATTPTTANSMFYDNTHAAHGVLSIAVPQPITTPNADSGQWNLTATTANLYGRMYLWLPATAPTNNLQILRTLSSATTCANIRLNTTNQLTWIGTGSATFTGGTSWSPPTAQWIRFEWRVLPSTTAGQIEMKGWNNADSVGAPDFNYGAVGGLTGMTLGAANVDNVRYGIGIAPTAFTAAYTFWMDDLNVNQSAMPGPAINSTRQQLVRSQAVQRAASW